MRNKEQFLEATLRPSLSARLELQALRFVQCRVIWLCSSNSSVCFQVRRWINASMVDPGGTAYPSFAAHSYAFCRVLLVFASHGRRKGSSNERTRREEVGQKILLSIHTTALSGDTSVSYVQIYSVQGRNQEISRHNMVLALVFC